MVEKMTSDIKLGETHYSNVWKVRFDTGHGDTVEFCHYEEAFAEGKEEGLGQGYDQGFEEGLVDGREEGIQTEYDRFWDAYQDNGAPGNYQFAFAFGRWNSETFKPKYDMVISDRGNASGMFQLTGIADISEALEKSRVIIDTSKAATLNNMYHSCNCIRVPGMDASNAANLSESFSYSGRLKTIDKIVSGENLTFTNAFLSSLALANVTFEGVIGQDINFQWSPLSVESMKSVITHLKNYAGTADAGKKTVKFTDACWTALEADSVAPDGNTWRDYVETTLGWLT